MNKKEVLEALNEVTILDTMTVHGNGFLKIELSPHHQLHVWHDALPKQNSPTVIHNHNFSFVSEVWAGALVNTIVNPRFIPEGTVDNYGHYHLAFGGKTLRRVDDDHDGRYDPYRVDVLSSVSHMAGSSYKMKAGQFHMANAVDTTITLMHKEDPDPSEIIYVLIHKDVQPDNSFDREAAPIPICVLNDIREILSHG